VFKPLFESSKTPQLRNDDVWFFFLQSPPVLTRYARLSAGGAGWAQMGYGGTGSCQALPLHYRQIRPRYPSSKPPKLHEGQRLDVTPADDARRAGRVSLGQLGASLADFFGDPTKSAWKKEILQLINK